jgi:hypothetical protein
MLFQGGVHVFQDGIHVHAVSGWCSWAVRRAARQPLFHNFYMTPFLFITGTGQTPF